MRAKLPTVLTLTQILRTATRPDLTHDTDQISDVVLSLEYVKQYGEAHKELNYKQVYLLEQCDTVSRKTYTGADVDWYVKIGLLNRFSL